MLLSIALYVWAIRKDWDKNGKPTVDFYQKVTKAVYHVANYLGAGLGTQNDFERRWSSSPRWVSDDWDELKANFSKLSNPMWIAINATKEILSEVSVELATVAEDANDANHALPWWVNHFGELCAGITAIFIILYLWTWFYTPAMIKMEYGGKIRGAQAALFGFEGHMNVATIERCIFCGNFGRMKWSVNGSPLSRSYTRDGERRGTDPTKDTAVMEKVLRARHAEPGQMRVRRTKFLLPPPPPNNILVRKTYCPTY